MAILSPPSTLYSFEHSAIRAYYIKSNWSALSLTIPITRTVSIDSPWPNAKTFWAILCLAPTSPSHQQSPSLSRVLTKFHSKASYHLNT